LRRCMSELRLSASYCSARVPAHKRIQVIGTSQPNVFWQLLILREQGKAPSLPKAGKVSSITSYARLLVGKRLQFVIGPSIFVTVLLRTNHANTFHRSP